MVLGRLVAAQKRESISLPPQKKHSYPNAYFQHFTQTDRFEEIRTEVAKPHFRSLNPECAGRYLRGKIFQDISYLTKAAAQPSNRVLLSPEGTLDFYRHLFPQACVMHSPLGLDGLKGIPVPDGILVNLCCTGNRIVAVYEYSLAEDRNYFFTKFKGFKDNQRKHRGPLAYSECVFVTPSTTPEVHPRGSNGIKYEPLPFSQGDLRGYVARYYPEYLSMRNNPYPTCI